MSDRPKCRCLLCLSEQKLRAELDEPENQESHRILFRSAPHLAVFSSACELLTHLQSLNGKAASDPILVELLNAKPLFPSSLTDSIFILLLLPVLHSTVRRVCKRYPTLFWEDAAQQALGALLEYLASPLFASRNAYLAFAIARRVRRATFEWAARESRSPLEAPRYDDLRGTNSLESPGECFERAALLRHFFSRAVEKGTLTALELDLLIQFKLEGGAENGAFSNAERQRLKRLLGKLRTLANSKRPTGL
jgi:hypothetical protein